MSDKPFDPTPSRLARARREGDHPVSHDAVAVGAFAGALLALIAAVPSTAETARALFRRASTGTLDPFELLAFGMPALVCGAGGIAGAVLAATAQTGGLTFRIPEPRFEALLSLEGIKQRFGSDALVAAARGTSALVLSGGAIAWMLRGRLDTLAVRRPLAAAVNDGWHAIELSFALVLAVGTALVAVDVIATRVAWRRRLRMSQDDLRRDHRESDGEPETKARRRRLHRGLIRGGLHEVRRAGFVVVNPEHVAVALRYDPNADEVPQILVRAIDEGALRVKSVAREHRIPIVENPSLARALYAHGTLGGIPRELYAAVAHVVAALARAVRL